MVLYLFMFIPLKYLKVFISLRCVVMSDWLMDQPLHTVIGAVLGSVGIN